MGPFTRTFWVPKDRFWGLGLSFRVMFWGKALGSMLRLWGLIFGFGTLCFKVWVESVGFKFLGHVSDGNLSWIVCVQVLVLSCLRYFLFNVIGLSFMV